jgi:hypothetical protein
VSGKLSSTCHSERQGCRSKTKPIITIIVCLLEQQCNTPRIELSAEFQADELAGSVILSLAQELVAIANSCAQSGVRFEVADYDKAWGKFEGEFKLKLNEYYSLDDETQIQVIH